MTDLRSRLAQRLGQLPSHLAFVLSVHLFGENLVDALIERKSPTARPILEDHRSYPFSVKLTLVFNMNLIPPGLYENLRTLNALRNEVAHRMEVDLPAYFEQRLAPRLSDRTGKPCFPDAVQRAAAMRFDLDESLRMLHALREVTFDWLHDECASAGIVR